MSANSEQKIIAVIGGTGAQGRPVIRHILKPSDDGAPSPFKIRALTRDPTHHRAQELAALGAELVEGSFTSPDAIRTLFTGVYGAFVNTDGFTVGISAETEAAFMIYQIAQHVGVKHFVWSSLDYALKHGGWDPKYEVDHVNAKGRFADFLVSQYDVSEMSITSLTTGAYIEMLTHILAPLKTRDDGTVVFVAPLGTTGIVNLVGLEDIGWWSRYVFDNVSKTRSQNLLITSEPTTWPQLVNTFTRVTGIKAEYVPLSMDAYWNLWDDVDEALAHDMRGEQTRGMKVKTYRQNFTAFYWMWHDNINPARDLAWIRKTHPGTLTLERWIRENHYTGQHSPLLKSGEDGKKRPHVNAEKLAML